MSDKQYISKKLNEDFFDEIEPDVIAQDVNPIEVKSYDYLINVTIPIHDMPITFPELFKKIHKMMPFVLKSQPIVEEISKVFIHKQTEQEELDENNYEGKISKNDYYISFSSFIIVNRNSKPKNVIDLFKSLLSMNFYSQQKNISVAVYEYDVYHPDIINYSDFDHPKSSLCVFSDKKRLEYKKLYDEVMANRSWGMMFIKDLVKIVHHFIGPGHYMDIMNKIGCYP